MDWTIDPHTVSVKFCAILPQKIFLLVGLLLQQVVLFQSKDSQVSAAML